MRQRAQRRMDEGIARAAPRFVFFARVVLVFGCLAAPQSAFGAPPDDSEAAPEASPEATSIGAPEAGGEAITVEEAWRRLSQPPSGYYRVVGTFAFGRGLRFNNPYRLQTQLGEEPESLSLTASYIDLGAAVALGKPDGLQHGAALHFSAALSGVSQQVLTPSYFAVLRGPRRVLGCARFGPAIILSPDPSVGAELGVGAAFFVTAKIAIYGELIGDIFYGAGTTDVKYGVYPVLSGQLGLLIDHEVLP
jgi:hypothetical protein